MSYGQYHGIREVWQATWDIILEAEMLKECAAASLAVAMSMSPDRWPRQVEMGGKLWGLVAYLSLPEGLTQAA